MGEEVDMEGEREEGEREGAKRERMKALPFGIGI